MPLKWLIADSSLLESSNRKEEDCDAIKMRSTAGHTTGGCNVVFEKLKVCDKIIESIYFEARLFFSIFHIV